MQRLILRRRHLENDELDQLVAACDVISVVQLNKGPSGIMGKALTVAPAVAAALRELCTWDVGRVGAEGLPPATPETFAETLLGVRPDGRLPGS